MDRLAEQTGRRVALTTERGDVIADSASDGRGGAPALPSTSTAEVDPLSPTSTSLVTVEAAVAGEYTVGHVVPVPEETAVGGDVTVGSGGETVLDIDGGTAAGGLGMDRVTTTGVLPGWRMTQAETVRRSELSSEASDCLRDSLGMDAELVVEHSGQLLLFDAESRGLIAEVLGEVVSIVDNEGDIATQDPAGGNVSERITECIPDELGQASDAALEYNRREVGLLETCLAEEGVPYSATTDDSGLRRLVREGTTESVDGGGAQRQTADNQAWSSCVAEAQAEAMSEVVADPALLYTGTTDRFAPFGAGWWRTVLVTLGVLAVATGVTVLAGRRLTRPIRALTAAAGRMGAGDHGARVDVRGRDEVGQLALAFNSMAESIQRNDTQRRAMVSDIAHELRTPLANVRGYLEAAEDGVVPLDPAFVVSLLEESTLLQRLIDDLQELALADAGMLKVHPEPRDAVDLARQVVGAHRASAEESGVTLRASLGDEVGEAGGQVREDPGEQQVHVDAERIRQALGNLLANAIRFTPDGGEVSVVVRRDGSFVLLSVEDNGPGIPEEHVSRLFDRFYRVEASRSRQTGGSGLGLAIAKHLVEAHDGSIEVFSTEGVGSVFTIRLPACDGAQTDVLPGQGARSG